jgi:hypothetical protein
MVLKPSTVPFCLPKRQQILGLSQIELFQLGFREEKNAASKGI